jgi:hypothetical protein
MHSGGIDTAVICSGVSDTTVTCTVVSLTFLADFLREFEAIFKKALARESVALGELFDEKNRGRKSHVRVPSKKHFHENSM